MVTIIRLLIWKTVINISEILNDKFKRGYMMSYDKNSVLVDRKTKRQYNIDHGWRNIMVLQKIYYRY